MSNIAVAVGVNRSYILSAKHFLDQFSSLILCGTILKYNLVNYLFALSTSLFDGNIGLSEEILTI